MENISVRGKKSVITLNPLFYPAKKVKEAVLAFKKIGKIDMKQKEQKSRIKITIIPASNRININEISLEFCDYLLSLIQSDQSS